MTSTESIDVHAVTVVDNVVRYLNTLDEERDDVDVPNDIRKELFDLSDQLVSNVDPDEYEYKPEIFGWAERIRG